MIAIILLIILHIWLCRQGGDHFWSKSRLNISLLMLDIEHLARGKGCVEIRASHYKYQDLASHLRGFFTSAVNRASQRVTIPSLSES